MLGVFGSVLLYIYVFPPARRRGRPPPWGAFWIRYFKIRLLGLGLHTLHD